MVMQVGIDTSAFLQRLRVQIGPSMFLRQVRQYCVGLAQRVSAVRLLDARNGATRILGQIIRVSAAALATVSGIDQLHFEGLLF